MSLCWFIWSTSKDNTNESLNENDIDNDADSDNWSSPPAATAQAVGVSSNFKSSDFTLNPGSLSVRR